MKGSGFSGPLMSFIPCSGELGQDISDPYYNSWYHGYSFLECNESRAFWVSWVVAKMIFIKQRLSSVQSRLDKVL